MPAARPAVSGERFGRLVVVRDIGIPASGGSRIAVCDCDCGWQGEVSVKQMRNGMTHSCGCLRRDLVAAKNTKHGMAHQLPEYYIWKRMRQRCNDPNNHEYDRYGGRGIQVDSRWDDFAVFLKDMGQRPSSKHSIDRFPEVNGNYGPDNCRWATATEQCRNKRNNRLITCEGKTLTLAEWSEISGIRYGKLRYMLEKGRSMEEILAERVA